eukprot:tig00000841_g4734.t1
MRHDAFSFAVVPLRGAAVAMRVACLGAMSCRPQSRALLRPAISAERPGRQRQFFGAPVKFAVHRPAAPAATSVAAHSSAPTTQRAGFTTAQEKLNRIRAHMLQHNLEAYIVPSEDAHQSEYVASCDARREYISGFTGSAGTALIGRDKAMLWTDGRYFLQAEQELDGSCWTLMRAGLPDTPAITDWLAENLSSGGRVGVDPTVLSIGMAKQLREKLKARGQELVGVEQNLVDAVWGADRPPAPFSKAIPHPEKYAGSSVAEKVEAVRARLGEQGCYGLVVPTLDEIAWLLNMRGFDVSFNPVTIAYCLVTLDSVFLYVDEAKEGGGAAEGGGTALDLLCAPARPPARSRGRSLPPPQVADVAEGWGPLVTVRPYDAIFTDLRTFAAIAREKSLLREFLENP